MQNHLKIARFEGVGYGKVQGLVGKDPRITVFRGVPYAKPPVGELRWKAPQPADNWEGVRKCYEYGDMPMMRVHPGTDDSFYKRELHPVSANFGGDPSRIVICGQSAGAGSVQTQLCSPMNEGIIAGAICQSAVSFGFGDEKVLMRPDMTLSQAEAHGADFFQKVGIRDLTQARSMDAAELMRLVDSVSPKGAMFGLFFGTCIDGRFVKEPVVLSYCNDRLPDVPCVHGGDPGHVRKR